MLVVPQGFSLSVAGVFVILVGEKGYPGPTATWMFLVGATSAFSAIAVISGAQRRAVEQKLSLAGMSTLNLAPVAVVPLAAWLARGIGNPPLAFLTGGFLAVTMYVLTSSAWFAIAGRTTSRVRNQRKEPIRVRG